MHHLFRLRHLMILAVVLSVGLVPLYANQQSLGAAANFAVLADDLDTTSAALDVNALAIGGAGNVGANIYTPDPPNITADGSVTTGAGVTTALTAASATAASLNTQAAGAADPTGGTGVLDGLVLTPGVYRIPVATNLSGGMTLALNGAGTYVIVTPSTLTFGSASLVTLVGGAAPANVLWVSAGLTAADASLAGTFFSTADMLLDGTAVSGKLFAVDGADLTVVTPVTVLDFGVAPELTVGAASGTAPTGSGDGSSALNPLVVTEGDVLTFSVSGSDPVDGTDVTLDSTGDELLAGYTDGLPSGPAPNVTTNVVYAPPIDGPQTGATFAVTYTVTDASGAICSQTVWINVNALPEGEVDGGTVSGQAPLASGTGTLADPFVVCEDDEFSFDFTGTDPDADGGPTTLDASVTPATANLTFDPTLPQTEGDDSVTTTVTFTPDADDAGETFTITFTTTDDNGESTTSDVVIRVSSLPEFAAPFTDAGADTLTACVGQTLQYDISATDPDGGDLTLYVDGTPVGAEHNPNFGGADTFGPNDEDLLNFGTDVDQDGDDSTAATRFSWTPIPGDEGLYILVYTAVNEAGCLQTTTVAIVVTNPPTISATSDGPVTADETLVVCPGDRLEVPITGVDPDGDTVSVDVTGAPGSATFSPTLPAAGVGTSTTTLSFEPTALEAGDTFVVTATATDTTSASTLPAGTPGVVQCDATASLTFTIQVAEVPVVTVTGLGDTTVNPGNVINVCTGDAVAFRVGATDADAGDTVTLTQSGAPGAGVFTPGLPATGNPVETDFAWTAGAAGQTIVTFTATDSAGCATTSTVTLNVSAVPTVTLSGVSGQQSGTGTEADPYVVCVGATPAFTFTATGADADGGDLVTLDQTGLPAGAAFNQALPAQGNPVASTFTFSPTPDQGGQTFAVELTATDNSAAACSSSVTVHLRVSSLPVVTATPSSLTVCEGDAIEYRIRATDADPGNVTIGEPTIVSSDDGEGAPSLSLTSTPTLPTAGNPVETVVTGTAPDVAITTTYTITYTVTDSDGCTATQVVTVTVQATQPTTVSLTQTPAGAIEVGREVCYIATVRDNCPEPQRVAGVPVCFQVLGTTGNNTPEGGVILITDENGEARHCFTPVFPGTVTVTAVIDFNRDCVADAGTTGASSNLTVPSPTQLGPGCFATGRGKVNVADPLFGASPVVATFNFDVTPKRNGTFRGRLSFLVPAAGVGRRGNITISSTRIDSMLCTEGPAGVSAVIFGVAKVKGHPDVTGTVRFRADALDAGTPGIPNDRFTITLLTAAGDVLAGPSGGNLQFGRLANRDDIKIRPGTRAR